jgi:peptidoglycan/LPS O-acetylase OafA/YrhL
MSQLSLLVPLMLLAIAVCVAFAIKTVFGPPAAGGRFSTIDGLRGYLAFFVFIHHSAIWYFYLHTGEWAAPPSNLYTHFGETSVALFFMITGFLFYTKILDNKSSKMDWLRFYVSRVLRLSPLYLFAMVAMFSVVALLSQGRLHESPITISVETFRWLGFTLLGLPNINGIDHTSLITAGVTGTLQYEWFFYLSFPLIALSVRIQAPARYLLIGALGISYGLVKGLEAYRLLAFLGGIAAAYGVRYEAFARLARSKAADIFTVGSLALVVSLFPTAYGPVQIVLISFAFALIAGGCSLFGTLTNQTSHTLGEMSYSIYLMHGITLFIGINLVMGTTFMAKLSPIGYWSFIAAVAPLLLGVCFATFKCIEAPAMMKASAVTAWLRSRSTDTASVDPIHSTDVAAATDRIAPGR